MKLTQNCMNDSCESHDQNSNKNESQCNQATMGIIKNLKRSKTKEKEMIGKARKNQLDV